MTNKVFGLFIVGVLALVLALSVMSAAIVLNPTTRALSVGQGNSNSFTFTINNNDATSTYSNFVALSSSSNFTSGSNVLTASNVVLSGLPTTLANGSTSSAATVTVNVPSTQATGTYTGTITIDADGTTSNPVSQTIAVTLTITNNAPSEVLACSTTGNPGELEVKQIDFKNNGFSHNTFGEDDEWFLFDEIEVEVEVENNGDENVDDVSVEWGLYNTQTNEWVVELDEEDEFNINDGDSETFTVTFTMDDDLDVDLEDLTDGSDYRLYVVATGTVDNATNTETCVSDFETASVIVESDFVILTNINMPETVQCGESFEVTADVWNIGDNDQEEVSVYVTNKELKLTEDVAAGDIDAFDSNEIVFTITLPSNVADKTYPVMFEVFDEDSDVFQNDFDDENAEFVLPLTVLCSGSGSSGSSTTAISAALESEARAGQDLVVKTTIKNTGSQLKTYTVGVSGYAEWADSVSSDVTTVALKAGESKDVTFTFDVSKSASGSQTFFVETTSGNEVARQPVTVNIAPRTSAGFFSGSLTSSDNLPWVIGIINVVLVLVIIIVAVRVARK